MTENASQRRRQRVYDWRRPRRRSVPVRTMFRHQEILDLEAISEVWGTPLATTVWLIVESQLAKWRRQAPDYGHHGLAVVAGLAVTRYATEKALSDTGDRSPAARHQTGSPSPASRPEQGGERE